MAYQTILDQIAKVVGGNQPDAANLPHFFSGPQMNNNTGDGSGVSGMKGCWSTPPDQINEWPMGVVLSGPFETPIGVQGEEDNTDRVRLLILVAPNVTEQAYALLNPFRDSIPAAFRSKLTLNGNVLQASVTGGDPAKISWGNAEYIGWDMTVTVINVLVASYSA